MNIWLQIKSLSLWLPFNTCHVDALQLLSRRQIAACHVEKQQKKKVLRCALYRRYNEAFRCSRKASCKRETVLMTKWHFNEPYGISHTYCISVSRTDLARFNTAGGWWGGWVALGNSLGSKSFTFLGTDLKHCLIKLRPESHVALHIYIALNVI